MKDEIPLSPALLLRGYAMGIFPMAETRDASDIFWVDPKRRGVLPLDGFRMSRSLARRIRQRTPRVTLNADFEGVLEACADRSDTWINAEIRDLYLALRDEGHAHSLEVWDGDAFWGGVYGVSLGGAFFGESMVSRDKDGSKIALAYLLPHLASCGFTLFDTQFLTDHLASLGAVEISRTQYHRLLRAALNTPADISARPLPSAQDVLAQRRTQTS